VSHHLDSPIARQDIRLDITDLYVFRGQTGTVFVINVCHSIFGPIPSPGYHPEGMYEFKIDLDGDPSRISPTVLHSTNVMRTGTSATSYAASQVRAPLIRMRPAASSRRAQPASP
jgi:hypothetical protein